MTPLNFDFVMLHTDDYLLNTNSVSIELLENESGDEWIPLFDDDEVENDIKKFALLLLFPYQISLIKFKLNQEYIENIGLGELDSFWQTYDHVSPSLRSLYKDVFSIPLGYPKYFIVAFPDVVSWAATQAGLNELRLTLTSETIELHKGYIAVEVLVKIVKTYLTTTGKNLECTVIRSR